MGEQQVDRDELAEWAARAAAGDRGAAQSLLSAIQDPIYGLALRMLGHPADAEDATQEILLVLLTHLGAFRRESAFRTWAWRIAANHLLKHKRGRRETESFEALAERVETPIRDEPAELPEAERSVLGREVRLRCTQAMLLSLDRDHRIAFILGDIFELAGEQAAEVLDVDAATYRKRLSRARTRLHDFMRSRCGVLDPANPCRCRGQISSALEKGRIDPRALLFANQPSRAPVARALERKAGEVEELFRAVEVIRGSADFTAPQALVARVRALMSSGRFELLDS